MHYEYEIVEHVTGLPMKAFLVSIDSRAYHWHSDLEIIWLLKGSVILQLNSGDVVLNEGDVYLLNTNEVHCLKHTSTDNLLLALQVNENLPKGYFKRLRYVKFDTSKLASNGDISLKIKRKLSRIMMALVTDLPDQQMKAIGYLNLLIGELLSDLPYEIIDRQIAKSTDNELERLTRIIEYINNHYQSKISLQSLADEEYLSRYRMSHFIKEKLGIGFQQLLNKVRLENALMLIKGTDERILTISEECGFSDIKYLNNLLKEEFSMTARELRKRELPNEKGQFVKKDLEHRQFNREEALNILRNYL